MKYSVKKSNCEKRYHENAWWFLVENIFLLLQVSLQNLFSYSIHRNVNNSPIFVFTKVKFQAKSSIALVIEPTVRPSNKN